MLLGNHATKTSMPYEVMVSYAQQDKDTAFSIVNSLEKAGINCWVAPRDILSGQDWGEAILSAIEKSKILVIVYSSATNSSQYVRREVERAVTFNKVCITYRIDNSEPSKALQFYLGSTQWLNTVDLSSETAVAQLIRDINSILQSQASSAEMKYSPPIPCDSKQTLTTAQILKPRESLTVVTTKELYSQGWTRKQLIESLLDIDYKTLEGLDERNAGTLTQWDPVVSNNNDGIRLIINEAQKIVGYWHFIVLNDKYSKIAREGKLVDGEITLQNMRILGIPGIYSIYFIIVAILPEYRGFRVTKMLFDSFCGTLIDLAENDIYIKEIYATAYTEDGKNLCESLNMRYRCKHSERGDVYTLPLSKLPAPFNRNKRLISAYSGLNKHTK